MLLKKKHIVWSSFSLMLLFAFSLNAFAAASVRSIQMDGAGCVSLDSMSIGYSSITVEAWAYKDEWTGLNKETMFSRNSGESWEVFIKDGFLRLSVILQNGSCVLEHAMVDMSSGWHHVAFTLDNQYVRFYVDGSQRDYFYSASGIAVKSSLSKDLCFGGVSFVESGLSEGWNGGLSEMRVWNKRLTASELTQNMHHSLWSGNLISSEELLFCCPFNDEELSVYNGQGEFLANANSNLYTSFSLIGAPVADMPLSHSADGEAYWNLFGQGIYSESSGGMHLAILGENGLEADEYIVYGHNQKSGTKVESLIPDLDYSVQRQWFMDADCDYESFMFRFDMSDAEAVGLLDNCLSYSNYKLLYKEVSEDSYQIISEAYMLDGDNLFFKNISAKSGFYALGRDNDIPAVVTNSLSVVGSDMATGGGEVLCDGGAIVTQSGLCWSQNALPVAEDSISIDGQGIGSFNTLIINLNPGCTYYVRAYAMNSEGIGYGDEMIIKTNKLSQSVIFPPIETKQYGDAPFNAGAYASSGLPINYRSSNESVASVVDGVVHINGVGKTAIWANQPGNISYNASTYRKATLIVAKADQQLTGLIDVSCSFGDTISLESIASTSGLPVDLSLLDSSFFEVSGQSLISVKVGETSCTAVQPGNANYLASKEESLNIKVLKRDVSFSFASDTVVYDGTAKCVGVVCEEDSLKVVITFNEDSVQPMDAGSYKVVVMIDEENYSGLDSTLLTIKKAEPLIENWAYVTDISKGESLSSSALVEGIASIEGEFHFENEAYVPEFSGELVKMVFTPKDTVNYIELISYQEINFSIATSFELSKESKPKIFPTIGDGVVTIELGSEHWSFKIYNISGKVVGALTDLSGRTQQDLSFVGEGIYFIVGQCNGISVTNKIIIN